MRLLSYETTHMKINKIHQGIKGEENIRHHIYIYIYISKNTMYVKVVTRLWYMK